jgi:hypothetical protein
MVLPVHAGGQNLAGRVVVSQVVQIPSHAADVVHLDGVVVAELLLDGQVHRLHVWRLEVPLPPLPDQNRSVREGAARDVGAGTTIEVDQVLQIGEPAANHAGGRHSAFGRNRLDLPQPLAVGEEGIVPASYTPGICTGPPIVSAEHVAGDTRTSVPG